jgi:hypothetical protein
MSREEYIQDLKLQLKSYETERIILTTKINMMIDTINLAEKLMESE